MPIHTVLDHAAYLSKTNACLNLAIPTNHIMVLGYQLDTCEKTIACF